MEVIKRMLVNSQQNCFITLTDHKPNFQNNSTVRLLNPAKNKLGRICKTILGKINVNLRNSLYLNRKTHKKLSIGSKALPINNVISLSCLTSKIFTHQFGRNS